ncbi:MAG: hypothetical protein ABL857_09255, partial [Rickettsiales bacterium]
MLDSESSLASAVKDKSLLELVPNKGALSEIQGLFGTERYFHHQKNCPIGALKVDKLVKAGVIKVVCDKGEEVNLSRPLRIININQLGNSKDPGTTHSNLYKLSGNMPLSQMTLYQALVFAEANNFKIVLSASFVDRMNLEPIVTLRSLVEPESPKLKHASATMYRHLAMRLDDVHFGNIPFGDLIKLGIVTEIKDPTGKEISGDNVITFSTTSMIQSFVKVSRSVASLDRYKKINIEELPTLFALELLQAYGYQVTFSEHSMGVEAFRRYVEEAKGNVTNPDQNPKRVTFLADHPELSITLEEVFSRLNLGRFTASANEKARCFGSVQNRYNKIDEPIGGESLANLMSAGIITGITLNGSEVDSGDICKT